MAFKTSQIQQNFRYWSVTLKTIWSFQPASIKVQRSRLLCRHAIQRGESSRSLWRSLEATHSCAHPPRSSTRSARDAPSVLPVEDALERGKRRPLQLPPLLVCYIDMFNCLGTEAEIQLQLKKFPDSSISFFFNTIFVSSHMYPGTPEGTQVIVGSMNMGYISDTARNRTHNLFRPKREPIPLGHNDGQSLP